MVQLGTEFGQGIGPPTWLVLERLLPIFLTYLLQGGVEVHETARVEMSRCLEAATLLCLIEIYRYAFGKQTCHKLADRRQRRSVADLGFLRGVKQGGFLPSPSLLWLPSFCIFFPCTNPSHGLRISYPFLLPIPLPSSKIAI